MSIRNTPAHYGSVAKLFHWIMAVIILAMLGLGLYMAGLPLGPSKLNLYWWHKSTGVLVLGLVVMRLSWRFINPVPVMPPGMVFLQYVAASVVHLLLYGCMFAMPVTGLLMSSAAGFPVSFFGWAEIPLLITPDKAALDFYKELHESIAWVLIGLVALHIAAALYHHFIRKDNVLKRMLIQ